MMPGEHLVWKALAALAFIALMLYILSGMDATVVCSNNQPC